MNSLQLELDNINAQLELLTYRKTQLDSIMGEYSDVMNRVKSLVLSMEDANVEPVNLLLEIEGIIYGEPNPTPEELPTETEEQEQTVEKQEPTPEELPEEPTPEQQTEDVAAPKFKPDDIITHKNNELWHGRQFRVKGIQGFEVLCAWESRTGDVAYSFPADAVELVQVHPETQLNRLGLPVASTPESEPPLYGVDCSMFDDDEPESDDEPETEPETESKPEQSKRYLNNIYWDNGSSVRVFIPKKRRYKLELEAIASDCIEQGHSSKFEIVECDGDWLVMFSNVLSESSVQGINDNFYPQHTDGEPEPQAEQLPLLNLMVPIVSSGVKSQLNARAWKRNDTLLIGFTNKKLLKAWTKWFKDNWGDLIHTGEEPLDGFEHCLTVLWYNKPDWERLTYLDYSVSPSEQQPQTQETSKFEYRKASESMTQVFKDGCLLGIAIDQGGYFESPQFKGQSFNSLTEVSEALWELVNKF